MKQIAFDIQEMKPGCVLIQAALGCDPAMAHGFSSKDWLINMTPAMKVYTITDDQYRQLVDKVERKHHDH